MLALPLASALGAGRAAAQVDRTDRERLVGVEALPTIGGIEDRAIRLQSLGGGGMQDGYLIRSPSSLLRKTRRGVRFRLLQPEFGLAWNSAIPFSLNSGPAWYGRGTTTHLMAGVAADLGPLSLVLAPQHVREENRSYEVPYQELWRMERHAMAAPWYIFPHSADLPLRFGTEPHARLIPGESSVTLHAGPLAAGAATESQWWGPGRWNALLLSNNAPGIPHLFLRTARPFRTSVGRFEGKWLAGRLLESDYFDRDPRNDRRSLSAVALTFSPAGSPGLSIGVARSVYAALELEESRARHLLDGLTKWGMGGDVRPDTTDTSQQITSLFGRWVFPDDGLEAYVEWARHSPPASLDDLLERPGFGQAYTLGVQGARYVGANWMLRLGVEATNLEQTGRGRVPGTFYTSARVAQGYTHRGRILGAAIGPGGSSQTADVELLRDRLTIGVFGGRIRWDNDTYYRKPYGPSQYYGHDVSLYGGASLGLGLGPVQLRLEAGDGVRFNYLWQNWGNSWETADSAVDVANRTVRLVLQLRASRRHALPTALAVPPMDSASPPQSVSDASRREPAETALPAAGNGPAAPTLPPDPSPSEPARPERPSTVDGAPTALRHKVGPGENFYGIARRYGVSLEALRAANSSVEPAHIEVGWELLVPGAVRSPRRHTVSRGETLFGLARRYGVRVAEIQKINDLRGTAIRVGQVLVIPYSTIVTPHPAP